MAMGDLVLAEDEVGPVMRKLQAGGVEQTALHNHVLMESPRVIYMHIAAHGDASKVATAIHDALGLSRTPLGTPAAPAAATAIDLDTIAIAAIHSHMLTASPRLFVLHFWANDDAAALAKGLRAALDLMKVKKVAFLQRAMSQHAT